MPIRWRQTPDGKSEFFVLGSWLPTADLFKQFSGQDFIRGIGSAMNPPAKVAAELLMNQDFFRNRPVDALRDPERYLWDGGALWGNERTNYLGQSVPTTVPKLLELIPYSRVLPTLDRLNSGRVFGEKRPYHDEMTSSGKLLKFITGLKSYPVDTRREADIAARELKTSPRTEGLTLDNLTRAILRAHRAGDKDAVRKYMELRRMLIDRTRDMIGSVSRSGLLNGER